VTSFGKAFTGHGLGNYMADRIAEAGLPERKVGISDWRAGQDKTANTYVIEIQL